LKEKKQILNLTTREFFPKIHKIPARQTAGNKKPADKSPAWRLELIYPKNRKNLLSATNIFPKNNNYPDLNGDKEGQSPISKKTHKILKKFFSLFF